MDGELISKKELLEKYGISYGALYRWKRMGLIPEEWFIKKATPTGQETFFERAQICERMELIIGSRDEASLKDLASQMSEKESDKTVLILGTATGETSFELEKIRFVKIKTGKIEVNITENFRRIVR